MNNLKKSYKKKKKFSFKLFQERGLSCTDNPTQNIVLCNAGQATGLEKHHLHNFIKRTIPGYTLPIYVAEKGQSYSFLVFNSIEASQAFYCEHGKMKIVEEGPLIYMAYVNKVPDQFTRQVFCHPNPPGLTVFDNFISSEEEAYLIKIVDWEKNESKCILKNRQVKHFGYEFRYGSNDVDLKREHDNKIPEECFCILERLKSYGIVLPGMPDQLTVNKYIPGQGIPSHVDKHSPFGSCILSLSLGGSVIMDWKHHTGKHVPVLVPNKSIIVMEGESRYDWQHGIQGRDWDPKLNIEERLTEDSQVKNVKILSDDHIPRETRISLTFRWTRSGPCECDFPTLCDSRMKEASLINDDVAEGLEKVHVHEVYEKIASHFSTTRHKRWPRVEQFVSSQLPGSVLLDLGSGNGKNILRTSDLIQIAAERSFGLLLECKARVRDVPGSDCLRADMLNSPFLDQCADAVICIAVIHHFCNEERRIRAIAEISRLLRPGGEVLITVWARDQSKANYLCKSKENADKKRTNIMYTAVGVNLPVHENRTQFEHSDLLVPWKLCNKTAEENTENTEDTLLRYYHVFDENELDGLCSRVPALRVTESYYEQGNWCVVCKKI